MDRELLDAEALVGHLVAEGSMFAFLAAHRLDLFPDGEFEDLFPSGKGRPSIPASVMASILVLQTLHDLSDRETAEAARCDLRWKVATGMALDHQGFDPSTLVYWRKRLAKSERPHRINDAVGAVVAETGVLGGRRKRAVDSTILADAVATQDTITQLIAAIRRVRRVVPDAAEAIEVVCTGHDYSRPGKPVIDWDEPGAKDALVSALVNDANALLGVFAEVDLDEVAEPVSAALSMLALVAGQDVEPAEGSDGTDGRWRISRRVAPDRVISQVDPEARHTRKSPEARRDGYRAHVAADPETGIITDDEDAGTVGCPAGHTRPISKIRVASFGALCGDCPLRKQCTKSKTGRKIVLHERDRELRQARGDWAADPELRDKYRRFRPNVERVVSQIANRGGRRLKLRYRGTTKNHAWLTRRTAGLNLRNLIGRGLTHTAGVWVLAPATA